MRCLRSGLAQSSVCLFAMFLIAGCAINIPTNGPKQPQIASEPAAQRYAGRMSLVFDAEPGQTAAQPFSGSFDLRGNAQAGELDLLTPLGSIVAQLRWSPGLATLKSGNETRSFPSAAVLIEQATGAALPPELLLAWLQGDRTASVQAGWQVDLSRHSEGRIVAKRLSPAPLATLRIVLEQQ
jgi:outer membrane lipoprotein LolB